MVRNELHELHGVHFFFSSFFAKFVNISAKFGFLNMRIRNNFKNFIFIARKICRIFKYYVNSMVISYSTCQNLEKLCIWVEYLIYAVLPRFQICRHLRVFSTKSVFPTFLSSQKNVFFQVCTAVLFVQHCNAPCCTIVLCMCSVI